MTAPPTASLVARLIGPCGETHRRWLTDRPELALTAARNCPSGWRVKLSCTASLANDNSLPDGET